MASAETCKSSPESGAVEFASRRPALGLLAGDALVRAHLLLDEMQYGTRPKDGILHVTRARHYVEGDRALATLNHYHLLPPVHDYCVN